MTNNIVEDEVIKAEMQDGLSQVDENLVVDNFESAFDKSARKLRVCFTAVNKETDEAIEISNEWV